MHSDWEVQITALIAEKAPITIPAKCLDFEDVISKKFAMVLLEYTEINTYAINLKDKQPLYGLIYSLRLVELETLKIYIKTNLANGFIRFSTSSTCVLIFFDKKSDRSF